MFASQVRLSRAISKFLDESEGYELLAQTEEGEEAKGKYENTHIVVIFRARDEKVNAELVKRINGTRKMYVSGTRWEGQPASRIAVSTWRVEVERDLELVKGILEGALRD